MASKPAPYTDGIPVTRVVANSGIAPLIRCHRWRRTEDSLQVPRFGAIDKCGELTRGHVGVMRALLLAGHRMVGMGHLNVYTTRRAEATVRAILVRAATAEHMGPAASFDANEPASRKVRHI